MPESEINYDQEAYFALQSRRKFKLDLASNLHGAIQEARLKGRLAGLLEAKREWVLEGKLEFERTVARRMLSMGFSTQVIAAALDVTEAELSELLIGD
jgi:predicted transposase YdaD